jgi:stage III sporulation protein AD
MEIVRIVLIGIVAGVLVITIKQKQPEIALQVSIIAGLIIFIYVLDYIVIAIDYVKDLVNKFNIPYESITVVLKIIGIAYICEFAVQVLKDTGENSIANKVEIAGRVFIVVLSLPILSSFMNMVLGMLE